MPDHATRWTRRRPAPLLLAALLLGGCVSARPAPADLVLRDGVVWTMADGLAAVRAVAVRDGRVVFVGDDGDAGAWIGAATEVIDLDGRMVLPAFHDAHVHPVVGGMELAECTLSGLATADEVLDAVRRYAEAHPDDAWIAGSGWELPVFPNANPGREMLDAVVPDRPALLHSADAHSAWANTAALRLAGIDASTPDPPDGRIERDPRTGEPTGTLREGATTLIAAHVPPRDHGDHVAGLRRFLAMAAVYGIAAVHEASASEAALDAYRELDRRGELTVRVSAAITVDPTRGLAEVARLESLRQRYRGRRLHAGTAKIFVDGVIESHTAALLEPYVDSPGDRGPAAVEPAALDELVVALDAAGFQVHVHAIGDRAVRLTLDAFAAARRANGPADRRHHVAHLQLVDPGDVPRFRALGVAANFQPLWAYADTYITDLTEPVLGPERSRRIYPIGEVARTGAVVAFGSDWTVSSLNPLEGIEVAVTRRDPDAPAGPAWLPDQAVDLATAVRAYTVAGAWLAFAEDETGTIEVGKAADLVVLDRDLRVVPAQEIGETRVLMTLVEGDVVYRER